MQAVTRRAWLVGLALMCVVTGVVPALGQCVQFDDPADMFRLSDAVFVGTMQDTKPTGVDGFHIVMHQARFKIERVWKGRLKNVETVGTVEAFQPGRRYLVFASASKIKSGSWEGGLQTSLECGWAEPEAAAERKLRWLSGNAGRRERSRHHGTGSIDIPRMRTGGLDAVSRRSSAATCCA